MQVYGLPEGAPNGLLEAVYQQMKDRFLGRTETMDHTAIL